MRSTSKFFLTLTAIATFGLAIPSGPSSAEALSKAQKEGVNDMIHQFIMNNPEVMLESIELYQKRLEEEKANEAKQAAKKVVSDIKDGTLQLPFAGKTDADTVVVEFLDYNCGFCRRGFEAVQKLLADEERPAKIAFVDLPVLGQGSVVAAKYALASQKQGKYFEYHTALFEKAGPKSEDKLIAIAKELGLDGDQLKKDAESDEIQKILDDNRALANRLKISGTPAFIIGDEFIPGFIPYESMKPIIDAQK